MSTKKKYIFGYLSKFNLTIEDTHNPNDRGSNYVNFELKCNDEMLISMDNYVPSPFPIMDYPNMNLDKNIIEDYTSEYTAKNIIDFIFSRIEFIKPCEYFNENKQNINLKEIFYWTTNNPMDYPFYKIETIS